ncbi:hypothetical protein ACHAXS_002862 [Conticribra weissflogii]
MTLTSFYRKIESFGFRRITSKRNQHSSYFHEYFLRGRLWLLRYITKVNCNYFNGNKTSHRKAKLFEKDYQKSQSGGTCEYAITDDALIRANCLNPLPTGSEALDNLYQSSLLSINAFILKQGPKARIPVGICNIFSSIKTTEGKNASTFTSTLSLSENTVSAKHCVTDTSGDSGQNLSNGSRSETLQSRPTTAYSPPTSLQSTPFTTVSSRSLNQMQHHQLNSILAIQPDFNFMVPVRQQNQSQIPSHAFSLEKLQQSFIPQQNQQDSFAANSRISQYQSQNLTTAQLRADCTATNIRNALKNECQAQPYGADSYCPATFSFQNNINQLFQNQNALKKHSNSLNNGNASANANICYGNALNNGRMNPPTAAFHTSLPLNTLNHNDFKDLLAMQVNAVANSQPIQCYNPSTQLCRGYYDPLNVALPLNNFQPLNSANQNNTASDTIRTTNEVQVNNEVIVRMILQAMQQKSVQSSLTNN